MSAIQDPRYRLRQKHHGNYNILQVGDVKWFRTSISMPTKLKVWLDNQRGYNHETGKAHMSMSHLICIILEQYRMKRSEDDPRYLVGEEEIELENMRKEFKLREAERIEELEKAKEDLDTLRKNFKIAEEKRISKIAELKAEAKKKNEELMNRINAKA